jgi:hypothetical protein
LIKHKIIWEKQHTVVTASAEEGGPFRASRASRWYIVAVGIRISLKKEAVYEEVGETGREQQQLAVVPASCCSHLRITLLLSCQT